MKPTSQDWTNALAEAWARWTPPDRPSPGELAVYEETLQWLLARKKRPRVMVLGSTSEFRDLYAKYRLPCTVVEYKKENYHALGTLMKRESYRETLVLGDWRAVKQQAKYDLILGDYCVNVLPKQDQPNFIANLSRLLSIDGYAMLKTFVRYAAERGDLAERLRFYRTKMKHRPILETVMAAMFKSAYDFEKEVGLFPDIWKIFERLFQEKKMTKAEFSYFESLNFPKITLQVYIPLFHDILTVIDANARLHGVRFGGEWFSRDVPIFVFQK